MNSKSLAEKLQEGLILSFNKPYRWTSFDLVNRVRKEFCLSTGLKKLKVGHAGTLDPLATGVLVLCTGKATKQIISIQDLPKEYEAEIMFGASTPSFDLETEVDNTYAYEHISYSLITEKINLFKGRIKQIPPVFSAKKINGIRAYDLARSGKTYDMEPVEVEILSMEILDFRLPLLKLRIKCTKGTYIRSLARDLGFELKSGSYLSALCRTAVGQYTIDKTLSLENFMKVLNNL